MEWLDKFNAVINYIEENLDAEIKYKTLAKLACCSEFHFSRMFSSLIGISLSEYIRRRRLTKAAFEIQTGNEKIIDIALKYGYESPDAFTRAFRLLHGISPIAAKEKGKKLKAYPRLSFQITIRGDVEMEYRIEKIDFKLRLLEKDSKLKHQMHLGKFPSFYAKLKKMGFNKN